MTDQQKAFADYFIECGNQTEAAKKAGYSEKSAYNQGNRLMKNDEVIAYITERLKPTEAKRVATADEVMQFFSSVMRGEVKDQFGLDASLQDRLNAGKELMKRFTAVGAKNEHQNGNVNAIIEAVNNVG
jgi:phage terminase small subunit